MSITTLDPKTALIVIDLQKGIVGFPTVHPMAEVLSSATSLTTAFRRRGLPVVLVNATGVAPGRTEQSHSLEGLPADWADLVPELNARPDDLLISKKTFDSTPMLVAAPAITTWVAGLSIASAPRLSISGASRPSHSLRLCAAWHGPPIG